jgi:hypothetical protein
MQQNSINPGQTMFLSTRDFPEISGFPLFGNYRVYAVRRVTESIYHVLRQKDLPPAIERLQLFHGFQTKQYRNGPDDFFWEVVPASFISEKLPNGFVDGTGVFWKLDLTGEYRYWLERENGTPLHQDVYEAACNGSTKTELPYEDFIFVGTTCFVLADMADAKRAFESGFEPDAI